MNSQKWRTRLLRVHLVLAASSHSRVKSRIDHRTPAFLFKTSILADVTAPHRTRFAIDPRNNGPRAILRIARAWQLARRASFNHLSSLVRAQLDPRGNSWDTRCWSSGHRRASTRCDSANGVR
ncbi:hypothetical protein C8R45DRAFT_1029401, partial [Mycena sanguinolenta]